MSGVTLKRVDPDRAAELIAAARKGRPQRGSGNEEIIDTACRRMVRAAQIRAMRAANKPPAKIPGPPAAAQPAGEPGNR